MWPFRETNAAAMRNIVGRQRRPWRGRRAVQRRSEAMRRACRHDAGNYITKLPAALQAVFLF
jgi:hypothetical protein